MTGPRIGHASGRRKALDRQQPRRSKRAADRPVHTDRYASQPQPDDGMAAKLAALVAHFNGEEHDHERR